MNFELGKQYSLDNPFKKKARFHQSKFRSEILRVDFDEYGNRLIESDAKSGLNFYDGLNVFNTVKKRYPNYSKGLYADMLRSEHIPFNIFSPLKTEIELAKKIFNNLLPIKIEKIIRVKIEFAPSPSHDYLNDKTAFDTYIEYKNVKNKNGIIGIEVKYSEQEYKLKIGSKEEKDIENKNSIYYQLTNKINIYKPDRLHLLPEDRYRQVWRNHLLGESMLLNKYTNFSEFTSVLLYPAGNHHFAEVSNEYKEFLLPQHRNRFLGITFEKFFESIEKNIHSEELSDWLKYLKQRYLFT